MSVPMKKPHIKKGSEVNIVIYEEGVKTFRVPKEKAKGLALILDEFRVKAFNKRHEGGETIPADVVFKELDQQFGRAGAALQGARLKEDLTQVKLAEKLNIHQSDLSKMEHGKRPIGKKMARKLAEVLKVDYRIFL